MSAPHRLTAHGPAEVHVSRRGHADYAACLASLPCAIDGPFQLCMVGLLGAGPYGAPRGQVGVEHPIVAARQVHAFAVRGGHAAVRRRRAVRGYSNRYRAAGRF
jgi:hypothetical protein